MVPYYNQIASQYPLFIGIRRSTETAGADTVQDDCQGETKGHTPDQSDMTDNMSSVDHDVAPSPMSPALEPPLTSKCAKDTVASICSSPVKAAA